MEEQKQNENIGNINISDNNVKSEKYNNEKTISLLAYLTIIGWIIAIIMHSNEQKSEMSTLHIRQSLGLMLTSMATAVAQIMLLLIPIIGWILMIILYFGYLGIFVFWLLGLISAIKGENKPLPLIGEFYQKILKSIIY
ncbi:MAG TPA: hypothetical protein P5250_00315 [Bacteroidales bacterium]|nr:hypothetical protein [Bacteroidales bacterium]